VAPADSRTVDFKYDKLAVTVIQKQFKILIADTAPLYPPLWGGPKRIWNLYGNFSQELFNLTYVGVNFRIEKGLKYSFNKIGDNFKEILCAFPPHYYFWNVFKKVIFKDNSLDLFPYLWMHTDWQFRYILNSQDADIVICSHPWPVLSLDKNNRQFFIYDAHNCEYLLMGQILGNHFLKSPVLRQVYKIEQEACKRSDLILACSENEKNDLIKLYKLNPDKIVIVTNGTTIKERIGPQEKQLCKEALKINADRKTVVFIGAYYKPNIDALKFIINRIAPLIGNMQLLIMGTVCDFLRDQPLPQNVVLLGKVSEEQLDTALKASDIAINPMFSGSGINIKMLDYMAYGLPIVTTECGARGIETDGKEPMIVSSADNFTENLKALSNNSQLCERLSEDGRSLAAKHYDWKIISHKLEGIILERMNISNG
ncbi:MAG: glycosyltransferase family 4 protein, partial [Candidatus Omnitrophica bacterium]|nr:glycosyltransferase family 4 protein [Candidatus Omnitrophota bacterium]